MHKCIFECASACAWSARRRRRRRAGGVEVSIGSILPRSKIVPTTFFFRYGGVTVGRAPAVTITDNVIYRTLGVGVSTGDRFISPPPSCDDVIFRKRARRDLGSSQQIPAGGGHVITGNLVAASRKYPCSELSTLCVHDWNAGFYLYHLNSKLQNNVVANVDFAGFGFILQDAAYKIGEHIIQDNEAYANHYGFVYGNRVRGTAQELYRATAWRNRRAGVVAFEEREDTMLREVTLSDNLYGSAFAFLDDTGSYTRNQVFRVYRSTVLGSTAASYGECYANIGLMLPRWGNIARAPNHQLGPYTRECRYLGNGFDNRKGQSHSGRKASWYVDSSTFGYWDSNSCASVRGIGVNPDEVDFTPDTFLTELNWHEPSVSDRAKIRLGGVDLHSTSKYGGFCYAGGDTCDAVMNSAFHDDGTTFGNPFLNLIDAYSATVYYSERNPAMLDESKCKSHTNSDSIVCRNYDLVKVGVDVADRCNECEPPKCVLFRRAVSLQIPIVHNRTRVSL